jgi:hypothetical protein
MLLLTLPILRCKDLCFVWLQPRDMSNEIFIILSKMMPSRNINQSKSEKIK